MTKRLSKLRTLRVRISLQNRLLEKEKLKLLKMKTNYEKSQKDN